jgi:hypothetical protein
MPLRRRSRTPLAIVAFAALACAHGLTIVKAQEALEPPAPASLERVRVALKERQSSPLIVGPLAPTAPDERRLGILTLVQPDTRGEFIRIRIPIGALVTGVARSIATAQYRRAEKAARGEVARAVEEFKKAQVR